MEQERINGAHLPKWISGELGKQLSMLALVALSAFPSKSAASEMCHAEQSEVSIFPVQYFNPLQDTEVLERNPLEGLHFPPREKAPDLGPFEFLRGKYEFIQDGVAAINHGLDYRYDLGDFDGKIGLDRRHGLTFSLAPVGRSLRFELEANPFRHGGQTAAKVSLRF